MARKKNNNVGKKKHCNNADTRKKSHKNVMYQKCISTFLVIRQASWLVYYKAILFIIYLQLLENKLFSHWREKHGYLVLKKNSAQNALKHSLLPDFKAIVGLTVPCRWHSNEQQ